jgi:hypothetical protein
MLFGIGYQLGVFLLGAAGRYGAIGVIAGFVTSDLTIVVVGIDGF